MRLRLQVALGIAVAVACAAACNPVLKDQVNALGGEQAGVRTGPLHRPGQPCLLCHDGAIGNPPQFSVAGTVFENASGRTALSSATVSLTSANGATYTTTTNQAGNFYVTPSAFTPKYPMHVSVTSNGTTVSMQSHVGWSGACATCHMDPAGPDSPGHVYFNVPDGGTP